MGLRLSAPGPAGLAVFVYGLAACYWLSLPPIGAFQAIGLLLYFLGLVQIKAKRAGAEIPNSEEELLAISFIGWAVFLVASLTLAALALTQGPAGLFA